MPTPIEVNVRDVLNRHDRGVKIRKALLAAWEKLESQHSDRAWWRRKSTRAAIVWENAVDHVINALTGTEGFVSVNHHDTISLIFDDVALVRLKKADMELRSRNVPTTLASLFHRHDADLFGHPGLQRVEAVYVLDRFETKIDWTGIVARENNKHLWHFELESTPAVVAEMPIQKDARRPARELAKLKKSEADRKRGGESE